MLRFILPHPESAIVFEYTRSDSAADVCHVILRREPSSDVGEYRFVRGPMRKDLFIARDANGDNVFLDDEGTRQVASRLGMGDDFGAKLKLAGYRSVVLNVPSAGKDNIHRRQLAARFSFSKKPLPHLDRLVAAVIKEHLDFEDFAEVAATIVMEKIGVDKGQAAKDKQLQLRQSRGQIEQWLRDRDAVERAIQLEPEVKSLRDLIDAFRALDMFHSAKELEKISSNGLSAIALISLLSGLLNVIRGEQDIYVPWATDEVGRFDGSNFQHLMQMMSENRIDAITASPALTPASYAYFAHRYVFKPQGVIAEYRPRVAADQSLNAGGA